MFCNKILPCSWYTLTRAMKAKKNGPRLGKAMKNDFYVYIECKIAL